MVFLSVTESVSLKLKERGTRLCPKWHNIIQRNRCKLSFCFVLYFWYVRGSSEIISSKCFIRKGSIKFSSFYICERLQFSLITPKWYDLKEHLFSATLHRCSVPIGNEILIYIIFLPLTIFPQRVKLFIKERATSVWR